MPPEQAQVSALLLQRSAEVLQTCVQSVARMEELFVQLLPPGLGGAERLALQDIDLLRQRLNDIATCLTHLSDRQLRHEVIDVAEILMHVQLGDLKGHLMGERTGPGQPMGECVLF